MSSATGAVRTPVTVNRPDLTKVGVIVWLSSELMFFAGLFAIYFSHRSVAGAEVFNDAHSQLNVVFSTANTTVLVLSSVTCQMAVWAAERLQPRRMGTLFQVNKWGMNEWLTLTYVMGAFFVGGQIFEYAELVDHGISIQNSSYGSAFYLATGFHGLHVLGGLIAFLYLLGRSFATKRFNHHDASSAVAISYYWHFVDIVWIALFGTIYILPYFT
ncbi:heme-copper oxidase subunit III [Pseudactinotalea sp. HY158]|uniref:aa3-type cytochrome oxidase subunit III n=1 Tax=unclassified Pseudactinotalea TaxID=2649176 RepID=UPI003519E7F3